MTAEATLGKMSKWLQEGSSFIEPFARNLARCGFELKRDTATTLQINVSPRCNQSCRHCHLEAGPERRERMSWTTIKDVAAFARRGAFRAIDITGGAPELHPRITEIILELAPLAKKVMLRSNLTVMAEPEQEGLIDICRDHRVVIVASFPSLDAGQTTAVRGAEVFAKSLRVLKKLNDRGYGLPGSDLELDLVSNPAGAFWAASQARAEMQFQRVLKEKWGIVFHHLYAFSNVPLGRFRRWLLQSGNFEAYMKKLAANFNPDTIAGLMCRSLVSVNWEGYLFDCDFNLAAGIHMGGRKRHVAEMESPPEPGEAIATSDHCYACTGGSGFT